MYRLEASWLLPHLFSKPEKCGEGRGDGTGQFFSIWKFCRAADKFRYRDLPMQKDWRKSSQRPASASRIGAYRERSKVTSKVHHFIEKFKSDLHDAQKMLEVTHEILLNAYCIVYSK